MTDFNFLSPSHIFFTILCIAIIIYLPRIFLDKTSSTKKTLIKNESDGVRIVDHHTASKEFSSFCENEEKKSRELSADWSWIVPPMSSSTTSVFHRYYKMNLRLPNYLLQQEPWTTARGQSLIKRFAKV